MKLALLPSALLALLASCGPNKHMNAWERQSSALDPVGITSKKMAAKHRADQASYKPGGIRHVQEGKVDGVRTESGE